MVFRFNEGYPLVGGRSGIVRKNASNRDLNCSKEDASLILAGRILNNAGPVDVKEFLRTVLMWVVEAGSFNCLHFIPNLFVA